MSYVNVKANFCTKILIFAVLKQRLLQEKENEASFVYIIFAVLLSKMIINGF